MSCMTREVSCLGKRKMLLVTGGCMLSERQLKLRRIEEMDSSEHRASNNSNNSAIPNDTDD